MYIPATFPVTTVTQHSFLQRQYTPLLIAAEYSQTKVVEILIQNGADIEARNDVSLYLHTIHIYVLTQ